MGWHFEAGLVRPASKASDAAVDGNFVALAESAQSANPASLVGAVVYDMRDGKINFRMYLSGKAQAAVGDTTPVYAAQLFPPIIDPDQITNLIGDTPSNVDPVVLMEQLEKAIDDKFAAVPEPAIDPNDLTRAVIGVPDIVEATKVAAADALAARISPEDVVRMVGDQLIEMLLPSLNIQQIYNEAVAGAIAVATSEDNMSRINAAASRQVLGRLYAALLRQTQESNERLIAALDNPKAVVTFNIEIME